MKTVQYIQPRTVCTAMWQQAFLCGSPILSTLNEDKRIVGSDSPHDVAR